MFVVTRCTENEFSLIGVANDPKQANRLIRDDYEILKNEYTDRYLSFNGNTTGATMTSDEGNITWTLHKVSANTLVDITLDFEAAW